MVNLSNSIKDSHKTQALVGEQSLSFVLPLSFSVHLGVRKGDFVIAYQEDDKRIVIEKAD